MTDMNNQKPTESLKDCVFSAIDKENVCVRSRWFFVCKEAFVWSFWILSVVVGALSVAVSLFVLAHQQYALREMTHESWFAFMVQVLPYVWLVMFLTMTVLAFVNLRCTNRGYRYHAWQVLLSSILVSIVGGALLHAFGLGYLIDQQIGKGMSMYMSQDKFERQLWQSPDDGRLLGMLVHRTSAPTSTVIFEDVSGARWNIDVSELHINDLALIDSEKLVRLIGTTSNVSTKQFHACGAFPWMLDHQISSRELREEREAFIERINRYNMNQRPGTPVDVDDDSLDDELVEASLCMELAPVRRLELKPQFR